MGIFQRLNAEQGITVLLITHEHGHRRVRARGSSSFRDGRVVADNPVAQPAQRRHRAGFDAGDSLNRQRIIVCLL